MFPYSPAPSVGLSELYYFIAEERGLTYVSGSVFIWGVARVILHVPLPDITAILYALDPFTKTV